MPSVLIVDDDSLTGGALARLLAQNGMAAAHVNDAAGALKHLREAQPDLVLLDVNMPVVGGLDLLDALRDDPQFADVRVAILSGEGSPTVAETARKLGACDFIQKGGPWPALLERIKEQIAVQ